MDTSDSLFGGTIDRRRLLARLGALGLAAGFAVMAPARWAGAQDEGTPVATPVAGKRPNGTRLWRVQSGAMNEEYAVDVAQYFPSELTINAGDSVFFDLGEFHTVTFLGREKAPALLMPETGSATPAAGMPRPMFNPKALFPAGGTTVDGTSYVNSGAPLDPGMAPFVVDFPKEGTYEYVCLVHRKVMKGKITVQANGASIEHEQDYYDEETAKKQKDLFDRGEALLEKAKAEASPTASGGSNPWEVSAGLSDKEVDVLQFVPDTLRIKTGDRVKWTFHGLAEPHTVTFLGGAEPPQDPLIEPQTGGPPHVFENPEVFYPQGGKTFSGKGLTGSGFMGADPELLAMDVPAGKTYELTFDTPGEYQYYCALHADPTTMQGMVGKIIVS